MICNRGQLLKSGSDKELEDTNKLRMKNKKHSYIIVNSTA